MASNYLIIIRMDDLCPTMNKDNFERYVQLFDRLKIKPLLGVVPMNRDNYLMVSDSDEFFFERITELKNNGYSIAMHGCHHIMRDYKGRSLVTHRTTSEFSGLSLNDQIDILNRGKIELEQHGLSTDIFMPPGHSYDLNTIKALKATSFKYISDGLSTKPYDYKGIRFIPADSSFRLHKFGLLTLCIHSNEDDYNRIASFIQNNADRIITFEEAISMKTMRYSNARVQEMIRMVMRQFVIVFSRNRSLLNSLLRR